MASYQLAAPTQFNFTNPLSWPTWLKRFERFRTASKLDADTPEHQIDSLIYTMGEQAEDIFASFNMSGADAKDYDKLCNRFTHHFVVKHNVIFERSKFNRRIQGPNEPVDTFITSLHTLAETCKYGTLQDELIRDRLVIGLRDVALSERLQLDSDLTLATSVLKARQIEQIKRQQGELRGQQPVAVDAVSRSRLSHPGRKPNPQPKHGTGNQCKWCGREPHARRLCPAKEASCNVCHMVGHYETVCLKKKRNLHEVAVSADNEELFAIPPSSGDFFMGVLTLDVLNSPLTTEVGVGGTKVRFKVDTTADVTAIPASIHSQRGFPLQATPRKLYGASRSELKVLGMFKTRLQANRHTADMEVYVVNDLHMPLLGKPAITKLGLISYHTDTFTVRNMDDLQRHYLKLMRPLGDLMEPYNAVLREDVRPYSLTVPRRIAIPLLPQVKSELERMLRLDVMRPITQPTDWCAGIVVVPKRNGTIRICVDLTHLNKAIKHERLQLPSEAEVLSQLNGSTIFSELDATSSYWQIPLTEKTKLLTTFITPFGRFCFQRLPFGISSATEHFERRMQQIMQGFRVSSAVQMTSWSVISAKAKLSMMPT